jgi:hypothetical protein
MQAFFANLCKSSEQRVNVGERQRFSPWESTAPTPRRLARSHTSLACLTWWLLIVRDGASRGARGRVTPVHQLPFARKKKRAKERKSCGCPCGRQGCGHRYDTTVGRGGGGTLCASMTSDRSLQDRGQPCVQSSHTHASAHATVQAGRLPFRAKYRARKVRPR